MDNSGFNRIPLEIRELIYQIFFDLMASNSKDRLETVLNIIPIKGSRVYGRHLWQLSDVSQCSPMGSPIDVFLACKKIHHEASTVYWRERALRLNIGNSGVPLKETHPMADRIAAMCHVHGILLRLAARLPVAVRGLGKVTISIYGFAAEDLTEMYDIISNVQKLFTNWRSPELSALPIVFELTDTFVSINKVRSPGTLNFNKLTSMCTFRLPVHDVVAWRDEVKSVAMCADLGDDDDHATQLEYTKWCLLHYEGYGSCSQQRGCLCVKHIGRTELARISEKTRRDKDPATTLHYA